MGMQTGKVKFFLGRRGWGFLVPDKGGRDVFVWKGEFESKGVSLNEIRDGTPIIFALVPGRSTHRPQAKSWALQE